MFHTILLDLFNFLTKPYLKELKSAQLTTEFGFLQGEILVENIELDCNGLAGLNLPIKFVQGHVESIHIAVPWGSFCHRSTVLEISGIFLQATVNEDYQPPQVVEKIEAKKKKQNALSLPEGKQRELWFYEKIAIQLAKNLVVVVKNVHIQLEDLVSHSSKSQSLDLILDSVQLGKTDKNWFSVFSRLVSVAVEKKLELHHLLVQWSLSHSPGVLDQESAWSPKTETLHYQHKTLIDHHEIIADMNCIIMEDSFVQLKASGNLQSSPINIDISQDLILSIAGSVLVKDHIHMPAPPTKDVMVDKPKIIEKHPLFPLNLQCSIAEVRLTYHSLDNDRSYSAVLSGASVSVQQQAYDSVISIKLSELAMGIHGAVEDHVINTFKGVTVDVIAEPSLKVEARLSDWDLTLPSLKPRLYSYFPRVIAKVQDEEENIAFVQVWEDTSKGTSATTCILLGLHNAVLMYHQAFTAILLDQLNRNFNLLSELAKYIPKQNLDLQCPEICVGLELSSVRTYIPIISLQKTRYIQTIPDTKKRDITHLAEKHDVKVDLLDISRYSVRNENVEFSSPCGPPLAQISSIDLLVNVFEQEDYPNNKLSDLRIEVEKFMLKGGMQFGIDLKNFITDIKEMILKMFFPGINVYPGTAIEPFVKPKVDTKTGSLQKTKLGIILKELEMCVLQHEIPFDQPKGLCDARFFAITLSMNEFYNGELNMEIAVPTWTMCDCRLTPEAHFTEPVSTSGMFSKPSIGISYQRDHNQHESVLLNISLTHIYLWVDFLMDMVNFWLQVVPPEKDKNPEVALEKLLPEQKGNKPRLEFVLNYNQDCDIVVIESAYLTNPTTLVVKFMGLTHFELDKYTWTQNMRVNVEKIVVECNYYTDINKQCWKLLDITSFKMIAHGKPEIDPTDIAFTLKHILVSLTPTSAQMLISMIPNMIPTPQDAQLETSSSENVNLWEPQPLDTNAWYLTGEDAASMSIDSEGLSLPCVNTPKMRVNVMALELRLDNEISQKIFPAVAVNCTAKAKITDWLKDVMVSAELGLEATYYNDQLAVWEPLLEPIESSCTTFRPWVVKVEVVKNVPKAAMEESDQEKLQSSLTSTTRSLAGKMGLKAPEFSINVTADEPLQLTLTKKFLKLIIDVSIDFITPTGAKPINQVNISVPTAPFKVVNKLGPTFEIRVTPGDTLMLKGNQRYAHAANDETLEFYYKKSKEVVQSSSLCSKPSRNLDLITINITKIVSWSDPSEFGGRKVSTSTPFPPLRSIPVTRTGQYYYRLKSNDDDDDDDEANSLNNAEESDSTPYGIVLDITLVKGQRVVTVRSPVQFINHTSIPLKICTRTLVEHLSSFTREYNDIEFAAVQPDQTCAVPLIFANYSDFSIEPDIPEYSLSTHFSRTSTEKTVQIDCESLLGSSNKNSLHIWLVIEEEEYVYNDKFPSSVPHHTFHFYPTAYFHNLLPFDIQLTVENGRGMEENHSVSKGQNVMLSCFSLEDTKTNFIYRIEDHKDSQTIQIKKEKSFVYSFHHIRGQMADHTLMHFDKKDTMEIYLYAPFWFVNKTELTLHYRVSHTKEVITHAPGQKLMLFSFGHKYDGKKAIKMRMQDSSEWSKSVSLDTAGYHGVIDIPDKFSVMKAGVKIRLTRSTLSKVVVIHPFYILVNKTKNRIICHEVGKQWLDIAPDSTKAFWPMELERPLMDINIDGHGIHSDPFNYNIADTLLLKMKGQLQAIKVIIHITTSTHVIVFDSYAHGDCPLQLANDFKRATIEFQQVTRTSKSPIYALGPCQSLMYTWDVPHEEHMIRWWVQGEKKKGKDQLMSLEDGSGKFEMQPSVRAFFSERGTKSSSKLGVPNNTHSIDVVDYSSAVDGWTKVDVRQKSSSPPPTTPSLTRTGSFDLHTIEPPSSPASSNPPKTTWRSVSAQPDFDDDTTPLVDFTDTKHRTTSLQRKGAIKRSSTKHQQQNLSESADKGDKKLCKIAKALSKSSTDLSNIDNGSQKSQKKPPITKRSGYWVSMVDGFQRILLFTPQYSVIKNCEKANRLNFDALEVNLALKSITVSLIDNNTNREVLLLSILPRPTLWEMRQYQSWEDVKSTSLVSALEIGQSQQLPVIEIDKLKVDMTNMKMISPVPGDLRCTNYNAIEAQLKMGANNIFVQLKAYDIQVDNQLASRVYSTPLYTEVCNKPDTESTGETWFLDAAILLRKDRKGTITRFDYQNATVQPIHLRTDVGLVLALMDMFSCLQQEMTEQEKLLLDVKYASLSLSEKEVALASKKAGRIFYENFNIPEVMAQITFTTKNLNQSKGDLSDESANLKFLKLFLTAMGTPFTEISEAEIKIGAFAVCRKSLTGEMLGDLIAKHYRHEALGQIFSVLFGLDLIKKPVSAVIGGTKKIFHGAYEGITHGIGELSEGIKHQVVRNRSKDETVQHVPRARTRSVYVPLWDDDFGIASTMIDILKSVTETDISSIHRARPTRCIQKDRIIRPFALKEAVGYTVFELLPDHNLTDVAYLQHFLLDDVPITLMVITNKSLYVAKKSHKWQEEYHTLLESIEYFVVEGNCLRVTSMEKKSLQHAYGSMLNRDITTRDNRTAKEARDVLQKQLIQLGLYKL